ncbi:MAG: sulfotransferase [Bacteroidetes bacterium]|nr:sulfotransferase [Bacteroidota bacterium]
MEDNSLQDLNRKRKAGFYKDEHAESYLRHVNEILQNDESKDYLDLEEEHATLFVFGLPRSGTTFMGQLTAHSFDTGYINNFMARFWLAPVTGIKLSSIILGNKHSAGFESEYATTLRLEDLHEYGYFWRYWLKKDTIPDILSSRENEAFIDWAGLKKTVLNMHYAFGKSWACKNIFGAYHIKKLSGVFRKSMFIYIERDPLDVAVSIMDARKKFYHDPKTWWSTVPYEYPTLKDLSAEEQVAGQVHYLRKFYDQELSGIDPSRVIRVRYEQAAAHPQETASLIRNMTMEATGTELTPLPGLPESFAVRTYEHRKEEKKRFADIMKQFK